MDKIFTLLIVNLGLLTQTSGGDFFGSDASDAFEDMNKQDKVYENLEKGFDSWEQRCLKIGGQRVLDEWLEAQENLIFCVLQNFDTSKIQNEIEYRKKTGDLDVVFKEYCDEPVRKTRPCLKNFLNVSRKCLRSPESSDADLNVTLRMIDAAVNFICHSNGDRLALFMSEEGMDCLREHQEPIMQCINEAAPELFRRNKRMSIDLILFNQQNCEKGELIRHCIEKELLRCEDPTPSNVINSLMLAMRKATPCQEFINKGAYLKPCPFINTYFIAMCVLLLRSFFPRF